MTIARYEKGISRYERRPNDLVDEVNRLLHAAADPTVSMRLALFELTRMLVYPVDPRERPRSEAARQVWLPPGGTVYGHTSDSPQETVYYPLAHRDADGNYIGLPRLRPGRRAWCVWNRQTGRWEMLDGAPQTGYRAYLLDQLDAGQSARALVWVIDLAGIDVTSRQVTVYDWFLLVGDSLPAGTHVKIEWFGDDGRWYVTGGELPPQSGG